MVGLTTKLVCRLTSKLVDRLTNKLVDHLTAKLVVVNLVKLHLTKSNFVNTLSGNVLRSVWRIWTWILGLKRLTKNKNSIDVWLIKRFI